MAARFEMAQTALNSNQQNFTPELLLIFMSKNKT
jgi:hypothetical protein